MLTASIAGGSCGHRRIASHPRSCRITAITRPLVLLLAGLVPFGIAAAQSAQGVLTDVAAPVAADAPQPAPGGTADDPDRTLLIATREAPPFAYRADDGSGWTGITIELMQQVAEALGRELEFRELGLEEMLDATAAGEVSAAAAALTLTADREAVLDFTHPFFTSGIGIVVPRRAELSPLFLLERLVSPAFLGVTFSLLAMLALVGAAVWLAERQRNQEQFPRSPLSGIAAGLWWSAVTMTTVGYGDKAPVTLAGRLLGLIWMFASILIISGVTAAIATSLTVNSLSNRIESIDDLYGKRLLTVTGSTSERWLDERLIRYLGAASAEEALADLAAGAADAVVFDLPILRYLVHQQYDDTLRVLPPEFARQDYGIALPPGSLLREAMNREVLDVTQSSDWQRLLEGYLGVQNQ
jgi:polar amino acid transport system substrate-binding protein